MSGRDREHQGPIVTLQHAARARRNVVIRCRACGWSASYQPFELAQLYGNLALEDVARRAKCRQCGASEATATAAEGGA